EGLFQWSLHLSDTSAPKVQRRFKESSANQTIATERGQIPTRLLVHPDGEGLADDILFRHRAPHTAVRTVVAVVAHHEIVPLRHYPYRAAAASRSGCNDLCLVCHVAHGFAEQHAGLLHAVGQFNLGFADYLGGQRLTVDRQDVVVIADGIAGQPDHALDEIAMVVRRDEHHDLPPFGLVHLDDLGTHHRQTQTVGVLVDKDEVADFQCWNHGAGRNLKGFDKEGTQHQHDEQDGEE